MTWSWWATREVLNSQVGSPETWRRFRANWLVPLGIILTSVGLGLAIRIAPHIIWGYKLTALYAVFLMVGIGHLLVAVGTPSAWLRWGAGWTTACVAVVACLSLVASQSGSYGLVVLWHFSVVYGGSILGVLSAVIVMCAALVWARRRCPAREGFCADCGYNLTGNVSGTCPECGVRR